METNTRMVATRRGGDEAEEAPKLDSLAEVVVRLRELPLEHALDRVEQAEQRRENRLAAGRGKTGLRWRIKVPGEPRLLA